MVCTRFAGQPDLCELFLTAHCSMEDGCIFQQRDILVLGSFSAIWKFLVRVCPRQGCDDAVSFSL